MTPGPPSTSIPSGLDPADSPPINSKLQAGRSFAAHRLGLVGLATLIFFAAFCFAGPILYPSGQGPGNLLRADLAPCRPYPLGTDDNGANELFLLMKGGQAALEIGFAAATVAIVLGTLYGAIAGLSGGLVDGLMMRVVDVFLSIPFLFVVLIIATRWRASVLNLSLLIGSFSWLFPARLVRTEVLSLRERDFIAAGKLIGISRRRQIFRHLIPNALNVVIVNMTFQVADAIIALSLLGFLGFGLTYPQVDWGDMLANANTALSDGYWWLVYPVGLCLSMVVLACNFVGEAARASLENRPPSRSE